MIQRSASSGGPVPPVAIFCRHDIARARALAHSALGPMPVQSVAALSDLGLDADEIARYFGVPVQVIVELRGIARRRQGQ